MGVGWVESRSHAVIGCMLGLVVDRETLANKGERLLTLSNTLSRLHSAAVLTRVHTILSEELQELEFLHETGR